jgi:hypothetical protein
MNQPLVHAMNVRDGFTPVCFCTGPEATVPQNTTQSGWEQQLQMLLGKLSIAPYGADKQYNKNSSNKSHTTKQYSPRGP